MDYLLKYQLNIVNWNSDIAKFDFEFELFEFGFEICLSQFLDLIAFYPSILRDLLQVKILLQNFIPNR